MRLKVLAIDDVVRSDLCCGCGACAAASDGAFRMIDTLDHGRRPVATGLVVSRKAEAAAMRACPGVALGHQRGVPRGAIDSLRAGFGPVLEIWEGHAADEETRHVASSGGVATALARFGLECAGWHGVLHVGGRADAPHLNETVMSHTADELRARAGSRYAPASPCEDLGRIEQAPGPCGFIGKPCDVAGAVRAAAARPALRERLALTIGIFCAGTPTTRGTLEMLARMGIDDPESLLALRYRGYGWPGAATAMVQTEHAVEARCLDYEQAWGEVLARHKQWRCRICPDHTGEFADLAVGDPWYRPVEPGEPGRSLIVVRTERGRAFLRQAIDSGDVVAWPVAAELLEASQPELLRARGMAWGRLLAMRLRRRPVPRFRRLPTLRFWLSRVTLAGKLRSILGTMRRGPATVELPLKTLEPARPEAPTGPLARIEPEQEQTRRRAA